MKELIISHFAEILAIIELIVIGLLSLKFKSLKRFLPAIVAGIVDSEYKDKKEGKFSPKNKSEAKLKNAVETAAKLAPEIKNKKINKAIKWIELLVPVISKLI